MVIVIVSTAFILLQQKKLESLTKFCKNKDSCNLIMPSENIKILEFSQYQTFDKSLFIIHADLEYIIEKIDGCKNNPENWFTRKVNDHISSVILMSTIS